MPHLEVAIGSQISSGFRVAPICKPHTWFLSVLDTNNTIDLVSVGLKSELSMKSAKSAISNLVNYKRTNDLPKPAGNTASFFSTMAILRISICFSSSVTYFLPIISKAKFTPCPFLPDSDDKEVFELALWC